MKTKTILLLCFFLGIGLTQLSAQNKGGPWNRSYVEKYNNDYPEFYSVMPVTCNGVTDFIAVEDYTITSVFHNVKNQYFWEIDNLNYTAVSLKTGEVFKGVEQDKFVFNFDESNWTGNTGTWRVNLKGDGGSRYIVTYGFSFLPNTIPGTPQDATWNVWVIDIKCF